MSKKSFFPELPCEGLVRDICGDNWRHLNGADLDGAWGVAIVSSILEGANMKVRDVASHLGVSKDEFLAAYQRLSMNGCFLRNAVVIKSDNGLVGHDRLAWSYYAGYASGAARR